MDLNIHDFLVLPEVNKKIRLWAEMLYNNHKFRPSDLGLDAEHLSYYKLSNIKKLDNSDNNDTDSEIYSIENSELNDEILITQKKEKVTLQNEYDNYINAIVSNITIFILENQFKVIELLSNNDISKLDSIYFDYINKTIEDRRDENPFHSLYKDVRNMMYKEAANKYKKSKTKTKLLYKPKQNYVLFAYPSIEHEIVEIDPAIMKRCSTVKFIDWGSPTDFKDIISENIADDGTLTITSTFNNSSTILPMSELFYIESIEILDSEYLIPLKYFIVYVFCKYPFVAKIYQPDNITYGTDSENCSNETILDFIESPDISQYMTEAEIESLAECFIETSNNNKYALNEEQMKVMSIYYYQDYGFQVTYEDIQKLLDKKYISNISENIKAATKKISSFWHIYAPALRSQNECSLEMFLISVIDNYKIKYLKKDVVNKLKVIVDKRVEAENVKKRK